MSMKLIAGLGNPGSRYEKTRHNVGFMAIKRLSEKYSLNPPKRQFEGLATEWIFGCEKTVLVMPQTFMNLSGQCVRKFVDFYKIPLDCVLVIADDLDLKFGQLRMRASGSSGGQKGLQSIISHLGTEEFARLKIGIGRPDARMQAADYVLQEFSPEEQVEIQFLLNDICDGMDRWVREGVIPAMNLVNQPKNSK